VPGQCFAVEPQTPSETLLGLVFAAACLALHTTTGWRARSCGPCTRTRECFQLRGAPPAAAAPPATPDSLARCGPGGARWPGNANNVSHCRPPQILPAGADPREPFQGPTYYFFKCVPVGWHPGAGNCLQSCVSMLLTTSAALSEACHGNMWATDVLFMALFCLQLLSARQRRSASGVCTPAVQGA
jgi:hypothetical protein